MSDAGNLAAVLYGINDLRVEERSHCPPGDDEVRVRMAWVGICGSDVHYLAHGRIGDFVVRAPMILGHEGSGVVDLVGKNVRNFAKGDRVAIEPGFTCKVCPQCKEGRYNLCRDIAFCATPPYDGNMRRFYTAPSDYCFKLPDHVSLEEGALLEPLSVGVHACRKAGVGFGSDVLITGAGPIGMVTLFAAKAMAARTVVVTDVQQKRLDLAKKFGADHAVLVTPDEDASETAGRIRDLLGDDVEKTIDCSGFESSVKLAIEATKAGGVVVLVGMGAAQVKVSLTPAIVKELRILGSFRYANDYPLALEMVASRKVNLEQLITDRFELEEASAAFRRSASGDALKVMVHCGAGRDSA